MPSPEPITSPRFSYWVVFFVISVVSLYAIIEAEANTERQSTAAQTNQKYAIACSVILFLLSMIVVFLHTKPVLSSIIVGTKIEGGIILILLCFWSALVAVVSDTRHGLATDPTGGISNGNLYYFTWAGLAVGVALMLNYIRSVYGLDISAELKTRSKRLQYWVYLGIAGIIQMGSSARVFDNHCGLSNYGLGEQELGSVKFCRRCKVGIVLGVFNAIGSLIVALLLIFVLKGGRGGGSSGRKIPWLFTTEIVMSSILCLCQAVGVPFLTSQEGPGAAINNIFYSSWACLAILLVLMSSWVQDWSAASSAVRSADTNGNGSAYNETERIELREQTVPIRSNGNSGGLV